MPWTLTSTVRSWRVISATLTAIWWTFSFSRAEICFRSEVNERVLERMSVRFWPFWLTRPSSCLVSRETFSMMVRRLPWSLPTVLARSPVTVCTSAAIFDSESSRAWTLVASRTQVICRCPSGRSRSTGLDAEPLVASSSASGRSADGKVLVTQASAWSSTSFLMRSSSRAVLPSRRILSTSPIWIPAIWTRLFQVRPVASWKLAKTV